MNSLPILLIGIPAAVAKYAEYRWNRQKLEVEQPVERGDAWDGFDRARELHPPLPEMETLR